MIAAARPSFTSVSANVASSAAIAMSEAATIPMPPARTAPDTRITTGLSMVTISRCRSTIRRAPTSMPSVRRLGEVGAGAEDPALGAHQHDLDRRVGRRPLEPLEQLGDQLPRQRVAVVRRVQGEGGDRVIDREVHELGHAAHPAACPSRARAIWRLSAQLDRPDLAVEPQLRLLQLVQRPLAGRGRLQVDRGLLAGLDLVPGLGEHGALLEQSSRRSSGWTRRPGRPGPCRRRRPCRTSTRC